MEKWEYAFEPVSKAEWIAQIEKDLKGKLIDSLQQEWWPGEPLNPIHHIEDSVLPAVILPKELFNTPPFIVEHIDASGLNETTFNSRIVDALQFGAQVFEIDSVSIDEIDIDIVLKNVVPGIIEWQISNSSLLRAFAQREPNNSFLPYQITVDDAHLEIIQLENLRNSIAPAHFRFQYYTLFENDFINYSTRLFQYIADEARNWINQLAQGPEQYFESVQLTLPAGADYFKCIVQMRVMHVLWQNLVLHFTGKPVTRFDYLTLRISQNEEKADHFLIRASMLALAGHLSGAGRICFRKVENPGEPDFYKRICRNIHHLLHLESDLPKGADPLAGAYTIDYYTRLWSERIWNNLKLE